jgi:hypothetical protein
MVQSFRGTFQHAYLFLAAPATLGHQRAVLLGGRQAEVLQEAVRHREVGNDKRVVMQS